MNLVTTSDEVQIEINKLLKLFSKSFVNDKNELILNPKNNIYFLLDDVHTKLDLICKFIAWTSRSAYKGVSNYYQRYFRKRFNKYLGTNFDIKEIEIIYTYLGNDCNRTLCKKFIKSNYNVYTLRRKSYENF